MSNLFAVLNALEQSSRPEDQEAAVIAQRLREGSVGPYEEDIMQIIDCVPDFHHKWTDKDIEALITFVMPRVWTVAGPSHHELRSGVARIVVEVLRFARYANPEPEQPDPPLYGGVLPSPDAQLLAPVQAPPISDLASFYGAPIFGPGNGTGVVPPPPLPNMDLNIAGSRYQVIGHEPDGYSALVAATLKLVDGLIKLRVTAEVASGHAIDLMKTFVTSRRTP